MTEREVGRGCPAGVEPVEAGPAAGVPVGAGELADHHVSLRDRVPRHLEVVLREAWEGDLHHGQVAQQLLDGAVHRRRVGGDRAVVVGVVQQHGGAQREHAGAGLEPAREDAVGQPRQVEVVDLVAVRLDDLPDQALAGFAALLAGGLHQELSRPRHGTEGALAAVRHVEPGRPQLAEGVAVLVGQPEQLADHQERHGEGEVRDQVHDTGGRCLVLDLVKLPLDDVRDPGPQALEPPHGELRGEQPAQRRVLGRVGEPQAPDVPVGRRATPAHERADVVAVARRVREHRTGLRLARDQPHRHCPGRM